MRQWSLPPNTRGYAPNRPAGATALWRSPPHKWAVGHTFEFSFNLPEPANSGNSTNTKKKQSKTPPPKSNVSTCPTAAQREQSKPQLHAEPNSASVEANRQKRAEYERKRNQTTERKEYRRRLAQVRHQKAKELGKCKDCPNPSIPGQTRCPTCAENHRQSRRRNDVKQKSSA